jgi:hypothetical protein
MKKSIIIAIVILTGLWITYKPHYEDPYEYPPLKTITIEELKSLKADHSKDLDVQKAFASGGLQCFYNCSNL